MRPTLDDRDREIIATRSAALAARTIPQVGDFVDFANGITRRISHLWPDWPDPTIQTSDGGSFYLGTTGCSVSGSFYLGTTGCSFSGGLYPGIPADLFTPTDERREGSAWLFHHDDAEAYNGVYFTVPFRVWRCEQAAETYLRGIY